MFEIFLVAFFGHRYMDNPFKADQLLEQQIRQLIEQKEFVNFLVGRNGEFDQLAASVIVRMRKKYNDCNSNLILMLPYYTSEYLNNEEYYHNYYTDVEISHKASMAHPKSAIQIRNCEMVDRADLVIFYVEKEYGGAWRTMKYAIKQNKRVINLAEITE